MVSETFASNQQLSQTPQCFFFSVKADMLSKALKQLQAEVACKVALWKLSA